MAFSSALIDPGSNGVTVSSRASDADTCASWRSGVMAP